MSKILSGLLLAGIFGISAHADVVRVEAGAGAWNTDFSGIITSTLLPSPITEDLLGYKKETKGYAWLNIKHPIPVLPNLRLEYAAVDFKGTSTAGFDYKGVTYTANATSDLTLDQIDVIMYYNLLDNTAWITLDLGLDVKVIDFEFNAAQSTGLNAIHDKETIPLPMGYARGRVEIPGTDIGFEGNVKYISYKNSKVMDYAIKADYTLVDVLPVDVGLEVGYRFQQYDIDGTDFSVETTADIKVKGVFVGATIKF